MEQCISTLADAVCQAVRELGAEVEASDLAAWIETPPDSEMGDLALPCFKLAPVLRRSPVQIADGLAEAITVPERFREIRSTGGYLNAFLNSARFVDETVQGIRSAGETYGTSNEGGGATVCIDFSSPNLAKPFHIGHLISTILGATLSRIFETRGYRPWRINYLGDWGVQVGFQILAWKKWGDEAQLAEEGIDYLTDLYVRINQEAKDDPEIDAEARTIFLELEKGDPGHLALWEKFRALTLDCLQHSYVRLGVEFDSYDGEAFCEREGLLEAAFETLDTELGVVEESRGAMVIKLDDDEENGMPPLILRKSDGASSYATRDVAAAMWRWNSFQFARNIYVTDHTQSLHFQQVFKALGRAGFDWADRNVHVPYGLVKIREDGKILAMSTRDGTMIRLEQFLDGTVDAVRRVVEEGLEKRAELDPDETESACEAVGVGSVIFWAQSRGRRNDLIFEWQEATDPGGNSGPYLHYAHARLCGILRKHEEAIPEPDGSHPLDSPEELRLARALDRYPDALHRAMDTLEPSVIAEYLLDLASTFSSFYGQHRVLGQEAGITAARLRLVDATRIVLKNGLGILGMAAPERM